MAQFLFTSQKHFEVYTLLAALRAPVTIVNDTDIEVGLEKGMKGRLISVDLSEDGEPLLVVDATEYETENRAIAQPSYYDAEGEPTRTVFESGLYTHLNSIFPSDNKVPVVKPLPGPVADLFEHIEAHYPDKPIAETLISLAAGKQFEFSSSAEDKKNYILSANYYSECSGNEVPAFAVATFHCDDIEESGSYMSQPDDSLLVQWNDSVSQEFLNRVFSPEQGTHVETATKQLSGRYGCDIPYDGPEDKEIFKDAGLTALTDEMTDILKEAGNINGLVEMAHRGLEADIKRIQTLASKPSSPSPSF